MDISTRGARGRSNTCDAEITPERVSETCVCVIGGEGIEYNPRTTGLVPGVLLHDLAARAKSKAAGAKEESKGAEATAASAAEGGDGEAKDSDSPATAKVEESVAQSECDTEAVSYTFSFTLTQACSWRGERCLWSRGDDGAQLPAVYIVGPFSTVRVRVAPPPVSGTGISPFGAVRGRRSTRSPGARSRPGAAPHTSTMNSSPEDRVEPGTPVHVALVITSTKLRFYLNGALRKEIDVTVKDWDGAVASSLAVGRNCRCEGVPATIRHFNVHTTGLSDADVTAAYEASLKDA